jgi:hypothetical protein
MARTAALSIRQSDLDPDMFYVKVRAVTAGVPNNNGDFFSVQELTENFKTFEGRGVFVNHESDNVEAARGKILAADLINNDPNDVHVVLALAIDEKAYPQLVNSIKKGYVSDVSMGATVAYSLCSICQNKASNESEYCHHIKYFKGSSFQGKPVYEDNKGVSFFEISAVVNGADPSAKVLGEIDMTSLQQMMEIQGSDVIEINSYDGPGMQKAAAVGDGYKVQKVANAYEHLYLRVKASFEAHQEWKTIADQLKIDGVDELTIFALHDKLKSEVLGTKDLDQLHFQNMNGSLLSQILDSEPAKPYNPNIRTDYKGYNK